MSSRATRPSPSASAADHPVGKVMKGNSGLMYKVAADKNGRHRWTPVSSAPKRKPSPKRKSSAPKRKSSAPKRKSSVPKRKSPVNNEEAREKVDKLEDKLYNKMKKWWFRLANNGDILVIKKDGTYKYDKYESHSKYKDDKTIRAIVWSPQSSDALIHFNYNIFKKFPANVVKKLIAGSEATAFRFVLDNFSKLFKKHTLETTKDYTLAGVISINAKALVKKFDL
jgi:hypothetical protein